MSELEPYIHTYLHDIRYDIAYACVVYACIGMMYIYDISRTWCDLQTPPKERKNERGQARVRAVRSVLFICIYENALWLQRVQAFE